MSEIPEAIFLDLFYMIFHRLLPQLRFNLYQIFTSDAVQNNTSHVIWFLMQCKNSWKSSQKMIFRLILRHFPVTPLQALHSSDTIALSKGIIFNKKKQKKKQTKKTKKTETKCRFFPKNAGITQNGPRKRPSRLGIRVKDLTKIRHCGKFHHYRNCSSQGKNFQSTTSASMKWLFSGFFFQVPAPLNTIQF